MRSATARLRTASALLLARGASSFSEPGRACARGRAPERAGNDPCAQLGLSRRHLPLERDRVASPFGVSATIVVAPHREGYTRVTVDDRSRVTAVRRKSNGACLSSPGYHLVEESRSRDDPRGAPSGHRTGRLLRACREREAERVPCMTDFGGSSASRASYLEGSMRLVKLPAEQRARLGDFDIVRRHRRGSGVHRCRRRSHSGRNRGWRNALPSAYGVRGGRSGPLWWIRWSCRKRGLARDRHLRRCIVAPATEVPAADSTRWTACSRPSPDRDSPLRRGR